MQAINRAVHLQPQRTIHIGEENKEKREKKGVEVGGEEGGRERARGQGRSDNAHMGKYKVTSHIKHLLKRKLFSEKQTVFCGHYLTKLDGNQQAEDNEKFVIEQNL